MIIGVNASRLRSGGAMVHIKSILSADVLLKYGIVKVHVWSYSELLDQLPDVPWLIKHLSGMLGQSIMYQLWWEYTALTREAKREKCDLMLYPSASALSGFTPSVTISRDMLSYEKGEMQRFGLSKQRLRLIVLKYIQKRSMKRAEGVIFLTGYAANVIQGYTGVLSHTAIVPHGIGAQFRQIHVPRRDWTNKDKPIQCIYVSNASMYKHQWHVVRAIAQLRQRYNISLLLVGGGDGKAKKRLDQELAYSDPHGVFVKQYPFVMHSELISLLKESDLFIFASSCENMPNTLIEGMAAGLPIACSNRGPMPEVLGDGGVYFDPEKPESIVSAIEKIIQDEAYRSQIMDCSQALAAQYSWERCAEETWSYVSSIVSSLNRQSKGKAGAKRNEDVSV